SAASPTTSRAGSTPRLTRRPCRTTSWSSTIRMRIGVVAGSMLTYLRLRALSDTSGQREARAQASALARRALDLERAADRGGPFAHRVEPEVARELAPRVEPAPIVRHHQAHLAIAQLQAQVQRVGAGV